VSDFQKSGNDSYIADDHDNEEGARILKMLESVAEPEFLMAEMSVEQLTSLTKYQAKLEVSCQTLCSNGSLDFLTLVTYWLVYRQEGCLTCRE